MFIRLSPPRWLHLRWFHLLRFAVARLLAVVALCLPASPAVWAQPSDLIRIIVPFPPGGVTDGVARRFAARMTESGQPMVVENKPGGNGIIAVQAVLAAPADGRTLYITSPSSVASNVVLLKSLPYDPLKDLTPVARLFRTTVVLVVSEKSPHRSVADLVAASKARELTFAAAAPGLTLMFESIRRAAGINSIVVNYRGGAPGMQDIVGGLVDMTLSDPGLAYPMIQGGLLRALAVVKDARDALLPDVPSTAEVGAGVPPIEQWTGVFVKAGTRPEVVRKFTEQFAKFSREPAVLEWIKTNGTTLHWGDPAALAKQQRSDIVAYRELMSSAGLQPQ